MMISTIFRSTSERNNCHARLRVRLLLPWASRGSRGSAAASRGSRRPRGSARSAASPCDTWNRDVSRSGGAAIRRWNVFLSQLTKLCSGGLRFTTFLPSRAAFSSSLRFSIDVLRRLRHHPAAVVESLAPGAPADLVKIPRAQDAGLLPVELAQPREQHGADRHVDAHAQRVRAADDLEQALLRELLDQHAILRQQPGVMQSDAVLEPLADFRPVGAGELEPFELVGDGGSSPRACRR